MDNGKREICVTLALHCFLFSANLDVTHLFLKYFLLNYYLYMYNVTHLLRVNTNRIVNIGQRGHA